MLHPAKTRLRILVADSEVFVATDLAGSLQTVAPEDIICLSHTVAELRAALDGETVKIAFLAHALWQRLDPPLKDLVIARVTNLIIFGAPAAPEFTESSATAILVWPYSEDMVLDLYRRLTD